MMGIAVNIREVYLINTSHVDITWWNAPRICAGRIVETMEEAVRLAAADPDFRFSIESVYAVRLYLNERPERREELVRLINGGRLDVGGLYVSPVSDYSSDEAIYRNFTYGKQWLLENHGVDTRLAREEDSPGHTLQFPQLCRGFGMRFARFSRGPMGLFRWRSPDGSEILTYTASYSWGYHPRLGRTFDAKWRDGFALRLRQAAEFNYHYEILMLPDGDDNALPNPDGPNLVKAWNAANESPKFRTATITDFFDRIEGAQIPVHTGDIPNQWAQIAVFQPDCFLQIRRLRHSLPIAELCMALAGASGRTVDVSLESIWLTLLEGLDHNWGGRLQGAYGLECDLHKLARLRAAADSLDSIKNNAAEAAAAGIPDMPGTLKLTVFNALSCSRSEPVAFTLDHDKIPEFKSRDIFIADAEGREYPIQKSYGKSDAHDDFVFIAPGVPPAGFKTFYISAVESKPAATAGNAPHSSGNKQKYSIENDFYHINLYPDGAGIMSIYDRKPGREILPDPSGRLLDLFGIRLSFNEVWALGFRFDPAPEGFYDKPENEGKFGESIVITGEIQTAGECAGSQGADVSISADGPVFSSILSRIPFIAGSTIEQEIILYHGIKRIDLRTTINWTGAENYLLNISMPFGPRDGVMTMDVPFGSHAMGAEVPGFWGKPGGPDPKIRLAGKLLPRAAKRWLRANFLEGGNPKMAALKDKLSQALTKENSSVSRGLYNWLDVSNADWGATLLSRHAPFDFTFGPSAFLFSSILSSAFFNGEHYLRRGPHTYVYSLTSHVGGPPAANIHQTGRAANSPLFAFPCRGVESGAPGGTLPRSASALTCDAPGLVMTALKPGAAPNEIVARFYESAGARTSARLTSCFPIRRAALCDFMEHETSDLPIVNGEAAYDVEPYKIVTVKIFF